MKENKEFIPRKTVRKSNKKGIGGFMKFPIVIKFSKMKHPLIRKNVCIDNASQHQVMTDPISAVLKVSLVWRV